MDLLSVGRQDAAIRRGDLERFSRFGGITILELATDSRFMSLSANTRAFVRDPLGENSSYAQSPYTRTCCRIFFQWAGRELRFFLSDLKQLEASEAEQFQGWHQIYGFGTLFGATRA